LTDAQRELTLEIKQAEIKRDFMLKRFDVTPDEILEEAASRHGFKDKNAMRRQMEFRLKVPEDPYKSVQFTKSQYK
jgi:hypothetical protein